jgi:glycosyltransferase involved in cell wall biosynthesis
MASGIPVIASKHDGGREALLDGKLGLLVDPANPAEVRAAIADLLERGERKIPEGLEYFAFPRFVERVHAIVNALT